MTQRMDLSSNAIAVTDGQVVTARADLRRLEALLQADPRFPDYSALEAYLLVNKGLRVGTSPVLLNYVNSARMPWGEVCPRFNLDWIINGITISRPVIAQASSDGSLRLRLVGNSY